LGSLPVHRAGSGAAAPRQRQCIVRVDRIEPLAVDDPAGPHGLDAAPELDAWCDTERVGVGAEIRVDLFRKGVDLVLGRHREV